MKLINVLRIFVIILFLISPIDILCEKISNYAILDHSKRKLEVNDNYIIAKYGAQITYGAGNFINQYRQNVEYIMYEDKKIDVTKEELIIEENSIIKIYLTEGITSLEGFFKAGDDGDSNSWEIISIDLSHFDSSKVESTKNMLSGCVLLKEINFN